MSWDLFSAHLSEVIAGLESGEVVELDVGSDPVLEVGGLDQAIVLLALGALDSERRQRLQSDGWQPPGGDGPREHGYWYEIARPIEDLHAGLAANAATKLLRDVHSASSPTAVRWSDMGGTPATKERLERTGASQR